MGKLQVEVADRPRGVVVRVAGHAGYLEAEILQSAVTGLMARRPTLVVFDLTELTFIASLAMGVIINVRRALGRNGGTVKLAGPPPLVREALQAAGLLELFEVAETVEEALGQ